MQIIAHVARPFASERLEAIIEFEQDALDVLSVAVRLLKADERRRTA